MSLAKNNAESDVANRLLDNIRRIRDGNRCAGSSEGEAEHPR